MGSKWNWYLLLLLTCFNKRDLGCLLANKGEVLEARDIFSQVREATADFADVWINIAHIYMEQKQYVSALQMYKNCMNKFGRQMDVQLMMYIARAYWKAQKYFECRDYIEKVVYLIK